MKKLIAFTCTVMIVTSVLSCTVFASDKTKKVKKSNCVVTATAAETLTAADIQAKIDILNTKIDAIVSKHNTIAVTHADAAKALRLLAKNEKIIAKHRAVIAYYENLLGELR